MSKSDGNYKWYFGLGEWPDVYYGAHDTREQAEAQAKREYPEGNYTIVEADKAIPTHDMFRADRVLEDYEEHNEEVWGEDGAEISATPEQQRELEKALAETLRAWMDKHDLHGNAWSFGDQRNEQYVPAVAPETVS